MTFACCPTSPSRRLLDGPHDAAGEGPLTVCDYRITAPTEPASVERRSDNYERDRQPKFTLPRIVRFSMSPRESLEVLPAHDSSIPQHISRAAFPTGHCDPLGHMPRWNEVVRPLIYLSLG